MEVTRVLVVHFPEDFKFPEQVDDSSIYNNCHDCPLYWPEDLDYEYGCCGAYFGKESVHACPFYGKSEYDTVEIPHENVKCESVFSDKICYRGSEKPNVCIEVPENDLLDVYRAVLKENGIVRDGILKRGRTMNISDYTVPQLDYFRQNCNFVRDERTLFELRAQGCSLDECCGLMHRELSSVKAISRKINRKIEIVRNETEK